MKKILIAAAAAVGLFSAVVHADILVRTDHTYSDGKVVSQNAKEVVVRTGADGAAETMARDQFVRIITTDDHGAALTDSAAADAAATQGAGGANRWNLPAEPAAPALPTRPAGGPTYYVIPLHGEVGETVLASALEKSLADAVARKPTVVVLDIDSPGGSVAEAEAMLKVLHHYNKLLRIVALTDEDLSAAAILSLSAREIYVKPTGTIGAATSYVPGKQLSATVEEKMQSAWRAVARNSAEEGGHEPLLADAMIDNTEELHVEMDSEGKPRVKEGPGDDMLLRKGKILTLTSHEAVRCGLASGEAEDYADLGRALHLDHWTECKGLGTVLADALPARAAAIKAAGNKIGEQLGHNLVDAEREDPTQQQMTVVRTGMGASPFMRMPASPFAPAVPGRPNFPMRPGFRGRAPVAPGFPETRYQTVATMDKAHWKQRSLACVVALEGVEKNLEDAISLAEAAGEEGSVGEFKDLLAKVEGIRGTMYDNRNEYGEGSAESVVRPTVAQAPGGVSSVADAERGLSGSGFEQMRAAAFLSQAAVVPAEQKKVIALLAPLIEPVDGPRQYRFVQAYVKWAGKEEVPELEKILHTPEKTASNQNPMNHAWSVALVALDGLDGPAAEKIIGERKGEFFFRATITGALRNLARAPGADQLRIERLIALLNAT